MKYIKYVFRLISNLQFIFRPGYWLMNSPYSKEVDCIINCLLDEYDFTEIGTHTAMLGPYKVWIENRPFGCMNFYGQGLPEDLRPSRRTIKRALDKLDNRAIDATKIAKQELIIIQKKVCKKQPSKPCAS